MPSIREMRLRIRSIKNLSQVTSAMETVSASKVRRAMQAVQATRPYAEKAWQVLVHLANQPVHNLHPLLSERTSVNRVLVLMVSSDRGLAGSYNVNILRQTLLTFNSFEVPVSYITVGKKGRDLLVRRRKNVIAEFTNLPSPPSFLDVSPIGRIAVDQFLSGEVDQVYIAYTEFHTMLKQEPVIRKLLPMTMEESDSSGQNHHVFSYEPDGAEILNQIVPCFTAIQIYQSILSSQASEHAARMVSMRNATDNALELIGFLQLQYNKARQQSITSDMLDIVGGAEAQASS
ncbi:MAG TPA: ATP synthase F1 subunit gamma [Anaerolineaceae bacterium]|nr:ATP synthase F1 subunit gamma [Anaerolineaceae bacterium]HQO98124.1 ATP synthase F1 subunit gamma [Anaerolineaceae bacterium]HQP61621.1 ATP synthase F1 subunit gamma [Anaerolineaceae bacterium]